MSVLPADEGNHYIAYGEVKYNDVLITDEDLVESNNARNESYYSKLINKVTRAMIDQSIAQPKRWQQETLEKASVQIVKTVCENRPGRFIWVKELSAEPKFLVLSQERAAQKVSNDIGCLMQLLTAQNNQPSPSLSQAEQYQKRLKFGKQLIARVFNAEKSGLTATQAARTLDNPVAPSDLPPDTFHEESDEERKVRLQLRQRYLALARTNSSLYDFSKAMIAGWSNAEKNIKKLRKHKTKAKQAIAVVVNASQELDKEEKNGKDGKISPSDLPPSFPSSLLGTLDWVETGEVKKKAAAVPEKKVKIEKRLWNLSERKQFLAALEIHRFGQWSLISKTIPTRYVQLFGGVQCVPSRRACRSLLRKPLFLCLL